jgi:hypothetical protein
LHLSWEIEAQKHRGYRVREWDAEALKAIVRNGTNANHGAGIDVSPAVRDFLSLGPLDIVDWKFVDTGDVPGGPWSVYRQMPETVTASR